MKTLAQGLGRGYAPGLVKTLPRIPVAASLRYDPISGLLDAALKAEIPPEYVAAGVGAGLLWKAGQWLASTVDLSALDLLGAEPWPLPPQRQLAVPRAEIPLLANLDLLNAEDDPWDDGLY